VGAVGGFLNSCVVLISCFTLASSGPLEKPAQQPSSAERKIAVRAHNHAELNPAALPAPEASNKIMVHVYNYGAVQPPTVDRAELEARRIFRKAGIETEWFNAVTREGTTSITLCKDARGPSHVILEILPRSMKEHTFGVAFDDVGQDFGSCAYVFYDSVKKLAARTTVGRDVLLAHLLAHEIGHLLLGPKSHSPVGIMRAEWSAKDLDEAATGGLVFTSTESERMRSGVLARNRKASKIIVSSSE
jgi:hypothetical protein